MGDYLYVDNSEKLKDILDKAKDVESVGIDTEADGLHNYEEKVCLIQLAVGKHLYIVDPLSDIDIDSLLQPLSQKKLIFHGADYDLRMLKNSFGISPQAGIFDTMIAAQLLGFERVGLVDVAKALCGVELQI